MREIIIRKKECKENDDGSSSRDMNEQVLKKGVKDTYILYGVYSDKKGNQATHAMKP